MNRLALKTSTALGAVGAAIAIAACGGGDGGNEAASPLDNGLQYLPKDTPFAVAIGTDLKGGQAKNIEGLANKFPFGSQLIDQAEAQLRSTVGKDSKDVQALLGNDFVVGSPSAKDFVSDGDTGFIGAIEAKDKKKLDKLVEDAKETGEKDGAKLFKDSDGDTFAVKDGTLVVADSAKGLEAAIANREGDDHFSEEDFDTGTKGLSKGALMRGYVDVAGLLRADPDTRDARKVKWVKALRGLGLAASAGSDTIDVDFNLATDSKGLTDADLPIPAGSDTPDVVQSGDQIGVGVNDATQIVDFAQSAGKSINPAGFNQFESGKEQIEKQIGVSIDDDILAQLEGDTLAAIRANGKFGARADLKDPKAFNATLKKMGKVLPRIAEGIVDGKVGYVAPKKGNDFYALATAEGDSVVYGVIDGKFVIANDPALAGTISKATPTTVPGAEGAVAAKADAERLAATLLTQLGGELGIGGQLGGALVFGPLGPMTASLDSSTSGIKGKLTLGFD